MVVDTSAIMAVMAMEPEAPLFARLIDEAQVRLVSVVTILEAGILADMRKGQDGVLNLDAFVKDAELTIVPFDAEQASLARAAYGRFGKGRHTAALNFGDCAAYALAVSSGEPLLFKGNDFARTDVAAVAPWRN